MDIGGTLNSSINFGGTAAAPIKLDLNGKVVDGRLDMRGSAVWWEIYNGGLRDLQPQGPGHYQSWVIGGSDIKFHDLDCINGHTKIGWQTIDDSTYGSSHRVEFRNMRVHNIGTPSTAAFDDNQEHGFYDVAYSGHYIDCLVYDCAARAFQLRAAKSAHVEYCTWSGCGQGVLFGDLGATNCIVENFIGVNNVELSRYLVEEFDPSHNDSANLVRNGYAWNSDGRQAVQDNMAGVAVSNVFKANPQLGADYKPASGSPAAIYGCRTIPPTFF
jgi:hypothetical protein